MAGLALAAPPPSAVAAPGPAPAIEQGNQPEPAPLPVGELPDRRTRTSKTVRDAKGRLTTTVYPQPVHYPAASGRWQPIDTRLSASKAGGYGWASLANEFQTRFKDVLADGYLRVDVAGKAYTLSMADAAETPAQVSGSRVTYRGVRPGVDLRYDLSPAAVKETLVLADAAAPTSFAFTLTTPEDATAVRRADGLSCGPRDAASRPWCCHRRRWPTLRRGRRRHPSRCRGGPC